MLCHVILKQNYQIYVLVHQKNIQQILKKHPKNFVFEQSKSWSRYAFLVSIQVNNTQYTTQIFC